jgi:hypothetical protein
MKFIFIIAGQLVSSLIPFSCKLKCQNLAKKGGIFMSQPGGQSGKGRLNYTVEQPKKDHLREVEARKPISLMVNLATPPSGINEMQEKLIGLFEKVDPEKSYEEHFFCD